LKYEAADTKIRLPDRKALNLKCLDALTDDNTPMTPAEIFHSYTGIGGLHGLNYVDFSSYHDFSEAKKEIEQGQFFTPDALCAWVIDCIRPDERHKIADLTCGKGSFFNHLPSEENVYGCEIEPDSYAIASKMFDKANLTLGDVRAYNPGVRFHLVIGNPPFHLHWKYDGKKMSSQATYILKAAELLYPAGLLAVIVPDSFLGESTPKMQKKRIYSQFNHIVQIALDPNAFSALGVMNFPTKLLILQRKAKALGDIGYNPEVVEEASAERVYWDYVYPVLDAARKRAPKIQLQVNREAREKDEIKRKEAALLYQIKSHPRTSARCLECEEMLRQYYEQKRPEGMTDKEWDVVRLRYRPIMDKITSILRAQNKVEVDKVELVKNDSRIYYKAYSPKMQPQADMLNDGMQMQRFTQIVPFGGDADMRGCGPYEKLMRKKQQAYRLQTTQFAEMGEDPKIRAWLENWELADKWGEQRVKLNARQLVDSNLCLQKSYAYLHWSQGAGKTVSGTAQGVYRLAHSHTDYVVVVSSAISIVSIHTMYRIKKREK